MRNYNRKIIKIKEIGIVTILYCNDERKNFSNIIFFKRERNGPQSNEKRIYSNDYIIEENKIENLFGELIYERKI